MRILIAEGEPLIGMNLEIMIKDMGHVSLLVETASAALAALRQSGFDAAILDVSLLDGDSFEVAGEPRAAGVPFAFSTGRPIERPGFAEVEVLRKPYTEAQLGPCIEQFMRRPGSG